MTLPSPTSRAPLCAAVAICASLATAGTAAAFDQTTIPFKPGSPTINGCPSGFEALALTDLAPYSYHLPFVLDASGNGDGVVCGKPLAPHEQAARLPDVDVPVVFDFQDNNLKAAGQ
jgi:hypothetical protein